MDILNLTNILLGVRNLFHDTNQEAIIWNKNYKESNIKQGFGVQIWNDGAKFTGYFFNNKANGMGRFKHIDGDDYAGILFSRII